jgi:hypothetical protein
MGGCRRCEVDLTHCHGTFVRHEGGEWECSVPDCGGEVLAHDFVLTCADVWGACCVDVLPVAVAGA